MLCSEKFNLTISAFAINYTTSEWVIWRFCELELTLVTINFLDLSDLRNRKVDTISSKKELFTSMCGRLAESADSEGNLSFAVMHKVSNVDIFVQLQVEINW